MTVPVVLMGHLNLVRPLGLAGIPIVLASDGRHDPARASRYVSQHCRLAGFGDAAGQSLAILLRLGAELNARHGCRIPLFYGGDEALGFLGEHRAALAAHYLFVLNDAALADSLADKESFHSLCQQRGVLAPKTVAGSRLPEVARELDYPVIVKPRSKVDWYELRRDLFDDVGKAKVFQDPQELLGHAGVAKHKDRLVIQEYVGGDDPQLYSFHGYSTADGELLACFGGRKIRTYPALTGESSFIELVKDAELMRVGESVAAKLKCKGPFKIDLKRDPASGRFYTLEVNARFNLWHYLGAINGINIPAIAYRHLVDGEHSLRAREYGTSHRWLNFYLDYHAFRELRGRGALGMGAWLSSLVKTRKVYSTFAWRDPRPFAHWLGDFLYQKVSS